jgi:homogentisate 1,2-dioxygenase
MPACKHQDYRKVESDEKAKGKYNLETAEAKLTKLDPA